VPLDPNIPVVARRDYILDLLANDPSRRVLSDGKYSTQDFENAKNEPINLAPQDTQQQQQQWLAPHFVWAVRNELAQKLCGGADTCPDLERGGLKIITTLDLESAADSREVGHSGRSSAAPGGPRGLCRPDRRAGSSRG